NLVSSKDLLVFNDTQVLKARMIGAKTSGGRVEVLLERVLDDSSKPKLLVQLRANKKIKSGTQISLDGGTKLTALHKQDDGFYQLQSDSPLSQLLEAEGAVPLPPYIKRTPTKTDESRYQTIYAKVPGAVAAPTAGLHFDDVLFAALREKGVELEFVTLHVGAGTFQPVRSADLRDHKMHSEYCSVSSTLVEKIHTTRERGGRVVAIGTTSLRALESAAKSGSLKAYTGDTDIFIYPGYSFQVVDALMTNFHLPESTLIMLVSAFIGRERTLAAYQHAVKQRYRFFSYGDAMWLPAPAT
ncbi:MAG: tRNA preQ1(34) S-adenosylmethionine ribosyltransferase-isomerase QueA, partial [Pseudomonadota bacterium]